MAETKNPGALAGATGARDCHAAADKNEHSTKRGKLHALVILKGHDGPVNLILRGRVLWALRELVKAGPEGVTPITRPAPRWSDYVFKLRDMGVSIETIHEPHGGDYPGTHGRYVLHSKVEIDGAAR